MMILLRLSRTTGVSAMFVRMPGQGPRSCAAAPAAVGETILSGKGFIPSPAKWWGPAVLEAECGRRSEEHTSELQSLMRISYAVFCLKTKKKTKSTGLTLDQ